MASSGAQHFASMSKEELIYEQSLRQIMKSSLEMTHGDTSARKAEIDNELRQINRALGQIDREHSNSNLAALYLTFVSLSNMEHRRSDSRIILYSFPHEYMSRDAAEVWARKGPGGRPNSAKRTFEANIGRHSPPRPNKIQRPTPSPTNAGFTTPGKSFRHMGNPDIFFPPLIDLTDDDDSDWIKKQEAEEERFRKIKQQEREDAEYARRLLDDNGANASPFIPDPSSQPAAFDPMSDLGTTSHGYTGEPAQYKEAEPSFHHGYHTNSSSTLQPSTSGFTSATWSDHPPEVSEEYPGLYTPLPSIRDRMPGSFDDDFDDLFGDSLYGDPSEESRPSSGTGSSYRSYGVGAGIVGPFPPGDFAGQDALLLQDQQGAISNMMSSGSNTLPVPTQGIISPFTPASQIWGDQSLPRPGSLLNGSANPLNQGGHPYAPRYGQSGSGKSLSDIINRTNTYDYENGTDGFGKPLDQRVRDLVNGAIDSPGQDGEEIKRLIANIRPDADLTDDKGEGEPRGLKFPLYKHQRLALNWMKRMELDDHKKGGILADDMGLGKTISSLALLISRRAQPPPGKSHVRTTLIVAPVALTRQWEREIEQKMEPARRLDVFLYHNKKTAYDNLRTYDVVVTTYGTITSEMKRLDQHLKQEKSRTDDTFLSQSFPLLSPRSLWYRVILDEAQCIKNAKTLTAKAVYRLKSQYRWCLSGTPMMNSVSELSSLIAFLRIEPYCAPDKFARSFGCLSSNRSGGYHKSDAMKKLQVLLKSIMLRRTKDSKIDGQPIIELPPKVEEIVHVVFDKDEEQYYQDLEKNSQVQFNRYLKGGAVGKKYTVILTLLLRLRQACCHPYLHLTDLDYVGNNDVAEDAMIELAKTLDKDVVQRLKEMESFECPICYDAVENPLFVLPCGHETCSECFTRLTDGSNMRAIAQGQENGKMQCPQCRGPVDPKKTINYDVFKKVHMPEKMKAEEEEDDEFVTDSDDDSDLEDDDLAEDEDANGNLKGFVVPDSDSSDDDGVDDDIRNATRKPKRAKAIKNASDDDLESSELEDISRLLARHKQLRSEGDRKVKKAKTAKRKGEKEAPVKPHMLKQLRKEASKNKVAHKKYMRYLKEIWEPSAKVTKCKELIADIQSTGEKTIVFSQWTLLLDLLEIPLKHELGVKYRRYDGGMSAAMRDNAANDFVELPDVKVILVSLKAGNAGLNLTAASQVIIMDPFWNPFVENQAVDRAHRIGQRNTVKVHRILIKDTVEDRIETLKERKSELINSALSEEGAKTAGALSAQELSFLFGIGGR
ncbi:hypothetical protein DL768_000153 [Monosporascus sp. mg162]|nr:hypothetical protein DL768_000153 [Monosporascus sp. mg162]